jgi:transcription antitermination factor NusG
MDWVIIQLTTWAEKKLGTKELARELRRRTKTTDLEIYYPSVEDVVGKHNTAYSEYLFIEHRSGVPYQELERTEFFYQLLRNADGQLQVIDDPAIEAIRKKISEETQLHPGDRVKINKGPLKGNYAEVTDYADEGQVLLLVHTGDEDQTAIVPSLWCRRVRKNRT